MLMSSGYNAIIDFDKVVLSEWDDVAQTAPALHASIGAEMVSLQVVALRRQPQEIGRLLTLAIFPLLSV